MLDYNSHRQHKLAMNQLWLVDKYPSRIIIHPVKNITLRQINLEVEKPQSIAGLPIKTDKFQLPG